MPCSTEGKGRRGAFPPPSGEVVEDRRGAPFFCKFPLFPAPIKIKNKNKPCKPQKQTLYMTFPHSATRLLVLSERKAGTDMRTVPANLFGENQKIDGRVWRYGGNAVYLQKNKIELIMTTTAMNNLWTYIESLGLSARNRKWLAEKLLAPSSSETELNATTIKAIEDVKAGKTYKASSVDDLLTQCLG